MRFPMMLALAASLVATTATAQENWPNKPVRLVVTSAAGGGFDLMARILAEGLSQQLRQNVIVENLAGVGGLRAVRAVVRGDADGYTFLFNGPQHASLPYAYKDPGYDVKADLASVSLVAQYPMVLVTSPQVPAKTFAEFVAMVKAAPGKYTFGSSGLGGASHIAIEAFKHQAGLDMVHVPFRGSGETTAALLGGQIDLVSDGLAAQLGNINEGRVRPLTIVGDKRSPALPDVPATTETYPGLSFPLWVAVFAPAKTPAAIVDKMNGAIAATLKMPAIKKRYEDLLVETVGSSRSELDAFLDKQLAMNRDVIERANIKVGE